MKFDEMNDSLKIKNTSLGDEAKRIQKQKAFRRERARRYEEGTPPYEFHYNRFLGLDYHLQMVVRPEARAANLAYGFNRGHAYSDMEATTRKYPDLDKVCRLVTTFGDEAIDARLARFQLWRKTAEEHLERQGLKTPDKKRALVLRPVSTPSLEAFLSAVNA